MTLRSSFLKTFRKKEKKLVLSIFSFSHKLFNTFTENYLYLSKTYLIVWKYIQLGAVENFLILN